VTNKLLSERNEDWEGLPVHIVEASFEFGHPMVMVGLPGKKQVLLPNLVFALDDDWDESYRDNMKSLWDGALRMGSDGFDVTEYGEGRAFGCAVILHTPTQHFCAAMVFPTQVALENILLLVPASAVVPPDKANDEVWEGDLPVHVVEIPPVITSSIWVEFPEPIETFLSAGDNGGIYLSKMKGSRALIPPSAIPIAPRGWTQATFGWAYAHRQMLGLTGAARDPETNQNHRLNPINGEAHGLVVSSQNGVLFSVALFPISMRVENILLVVPASLALTA